MTLRFRVNFQSALRRFFRTTEKNQRHPISGWKPNQFAVCFRLRERGNDGGSNFYDAMARTSFSPRARPSPGPKAAKLRTIMMDAKRYMPMVSPMAICIAEMHINQIPRVLRFQIKTG